MGNLKLRAAELTDCQLIWRCRNELGARQSSFNSQPIDYPDHELWFAAHLKGKETTLFIVVDPAGLDIGYVRFDISSSEASISICLEPAARGKRHGADAIMQGCERMISYGQVRRIVAYVRRDNPASISVFRKAGFHSKMDINIKSIPGIEMEYGASPVE